MPLAVESVAKNKKCDSPSTADLSDNRSTPQKEVVFYVDCSNGERFYVNQNEITDGDKVTGESEQLGEAHLYIPQCIDAVRNSLKNTNSFNPHSFSISAVKRTSGNVEVIVPFDATNAFGAELTHTAKCIITTQKTIELSVF